jgi:hypothetical protein
LLNIKVHIHIIKYGMFTQEEKGSKHTQTYMYIFDDSIMKPNRHCLKGGRGNGNIMEGWTDSQYTVPMMKLSQISNVSYPKI